ncbi:unnamed protein product [Parajaminaea phylloscopi]
MIWRVEDKFDQSAGRLARSWPKYGALARQSASAERLPSGHRVGGVRLRPTLVAQLASHLPSRQDADSVHRLHHNHGSTNFSIGFITTVYGLSWECSLAFVVVASEGSRAGSYTSHQPVLVAVRSPTYSRGPQSA